MISVKTAPPLPNQNVPQLPDFSTLTDAEYSRVGHDLIIQLAEETIVIHDYFIKPIPLITADGVALSVADIVSFVNQAKPILVAANDLEDVLPQTTGDAIGRVTTLVNGPVSAESPNGQVRTLQEGDPIYLHDLLYTAPQTYVKITLLDGSICQLGPLSKVEINKYSYNPEQPDKGGHLEGNILVGIFRFISGDISGEGGEQHSVFNTPSATIGVRGSEIDVRIDDNGATTLLHSSGFIEVKSLHGTNTPISVYEPGTIVYIPIDSLQPSADYASPQSIEQFRYQLQPLDSIENDQSELPNELGVPSEKQDFFRPEEKGERMEEKEHQIERMEGREHQDKPEFIREGRSDIDDIFLGDKLGIAPPSMAERMEEGRESKVEDREGKGEKLDNPMEQHEGKLELRPDDLRVEFVKINDPNAPKPPPIERIEEQQEHFEDLPPPPPKDSVPERVVINGENAIKIDTDLPIDQMTEISQPENGQIIINPDGSVTYIPEHGFFGVDAFKFKMPNGEWYEVIVNTELATDNPAAVEIVRIDEIILDEDTQIPPDQPIEGEEPPFIDDNTQFLPDRPIESEKPPLIDNSTQILPDQPIESEKPPLVDNNTQFLPDQPIESEKPPLVDNSTQLPPDQPIEGTNPPLIDEGSQLPPDQPIEGTNPPIIDNGSQLPPDQPIEGTNPPLIDEGSQLPPDQPIEGTNPPIIDNGSQLPPDQPIEGEKPPLVDNGTQLPPDQPIEGEKPPLVDNGTQLPPDQPMEGTKPPLIDDGSQLPPDQPIEGEKPPIIDNSTQLPPDQPIESINPPVVNDGNQLPPDQPIESTNPPVVNDGSQLPPDQPIESTNPPLVDEGSQLPPDQPVESTNPPVVNDGSQLPPDQPVESTNPPVVNDGSQLPPDQPIESTNPPVVNDGSQLPPDQPIENTNPPLVDEGSQLPPDQPITTQPPPETIGAVSAVSYNEVQSFIKALLTNELPLNFENVATLQQESSGHQAANLQIGDVLDLATENLLVSDEDNTSTQMNKVSYSHYASDNTSLLLEHDTQLVY